MSPDDGPREPTSASARRSAPASPSSPRRSTSRRRHARARRRGHRGRGREPRAGPRAKARASTATRSAGTSSATCSRTRRRSSTASASSCTRSTPTRRRGGSTIPALVEVNLSRRAVEVGHRARGPAAFLELYGDVRGLMTMPPASRRSRGVAPVLPRACASSPSEHGLRELSMGTSQDYRVAAEEGATLVRVGSVLYGE